MSVLLAPTLLAVLIAVGGTLGTLVAGQKPPSVQVPPLRYVTYTPPFLNHPINETPVFHVRIEQHTT